MKFNNLLPIVVCLLLAGCNLNFGERVPPKATEVKTEILLEESIEPVLPAPIYYLSRENDDRVGLWRIENDGNIRSLVKDCCIKAYAVSSTTGQIAFVTDEIRLVIIAANGEEVANVDLDQVHYPIELDSALAWSPLGTDLALGGESGLWFYSLKLGKLIQMSTAPEYTNYIRPLSNNAWSPDGSAVLVEGHRINANVDEVGVMPVVSGEVKMTAILSGREVTWAPDSQMFYVSSNFYGMTGILPSLLQVTTNELEITKLVESETRDDGLLGRYLETAQVGPDNLLYYFYGEGTVDFDQNKVGLSMYRSQRDGFTDRVLLRDSVYRGIDEILWSEDLSLAVIVGPDTTDANWTGAITILPSHGEENAIVTPFIGFDLQWGWTEG